MTCVLCGATPVVARQLCNRDYLRIKRRRKNPDLWTGWPTPRTLMKNKGRRCSLCLKRSAYCKGLCRSHYYHHQGTVVLAD